MTALPLASAPVESASTTVLVLEAGRPDYKWDVFIHMPAALAFPIGSRFQNPTFAGCFNLSGLWLCLE